jgi:hypothetical protein
MDVSDLSIDELVAAAGTMFTNAQGDPDIAAALAPFGYAAAELDALLDDVEEVEDLDADQRREYAEQYAATAAANLAVAHVEAHYTRHRTLARLAHPRTSERYRALGLAGKVPDDTERLLHRAEQFWRLFQGTPALLAGTRITEAEVTVGLARVAAARAALAAQQKETGEAQRATRVRDDVVAHLRAAVQEFAGVAAVALADRPQLREVLGLLERS